MESLYSFFSSCSSPIIVPVCTKTDVSDVLNENISKKILDYINKKIQAIVSRQEFRRVYMLNEIVHTSAKEISDDPENLRKSPEFMRNLLQAICEYHTATGSFSIPNNWTDIGKLIFRE